MGILDRYEWHVAYEPKMEMKEVVVQLYEEIPPDITCRDLYFRLKKRNLIKRFPRKFKKAFFYGTKNHIMRMKIIAKIYEHCKIEEKKDEIN